MPRLERISSFQHVKSSALFDWLKRKNNRSEGWDFLPGCIFIHPMKNNLILLNVLSVNFMTQLWKRWYLREKFKGTWLMLWLWEAMWPVALHPLCCISPRMPSSRQTCYRGQPASEESVSEIWCATSWALCCLKFDPLIWVPGVKIERNYFKYNMNGW